MAVINVKIVRRSQSLLPDVFGAALDYDECVGFGPGLRGQAKARLMAVALKTAWFGLERRPIRSLLVRRLLPQPGHGPGEKAREAGHFHVLLRGFGKREGGRSFTVETDFKGAGDPGYAATSRMLGSVALCLATGQLEHPTRCGVLTPACSVGRSLPDFLRNSAFSIESRISEEK